MNENLPICYMRVRDGNRTQWKKNINKPLGLLLPNAFDHLIGSNKI